ncbi:uncharacterized protein LY89DRAFT_200486 [Mollisia scopiformis]|uniref:Peptidase C14 caspase domain-containing protein n=1 Tax=Mollisia scopiformis TaxID=149040 RepID=A0A194WZE5_MOLSC|nr:uncharacterized protein LY89DRAFT_200486 [Mollisia scopiformis]KUJ13079.1 hypothetical protein LY89DRAFT_200486 [Mollisia scopiformis]
MAEAASSHNVPYYKHVFVLVVSWVDDDLGVLEEEAIPLAQVFRDKYNYQVEHFLLPLAQPEAVFHQFFKERLSAILCSPDNLLILYYSGHGSKGSSGLIWGPGNEGHEKAYEEYLYPPTIRWNKFQERFIDPARADVVLMIDSCHSGAAPSASLAATLLASPEQANFPDLPPLNNHHRVEVLASCGKDSLALAPGRRSFSHSLIKELKSRAKTGAPFTASELLFAIIPRLKAQDKKWIWQKKSVPPLFLRVCGDPDIPSIELRVMERREDNYEDEDDTLVEKKGFWTRVFRTC